MPAEGYPETLTIGELAGILDVAKRTVTAWIGEGLITVKRGPGRRVAIPSAGVAEFLPERGETLMCQEAFRKLTGLTKAQIRYDTARGLLYAAKTPGGSCRYRLSEAAATRRRRAAAQ